MNDICYTDIMAITVMEFQVRDTILVRFYPKDKYSTKRFFNTIVNECLVSGLQSNHQMTCFVVQSLVENVPLNRLIVLNTIIIMIN